MTTVIVQHLIYKLKIPKISRLPNASLSEETETCRKDSIVGSDSRNGYMKIQKLKQFSPECITNCNNLTVKLRNALNKLKTLIDDRKIVICESNKDGKIIILNFTDFNEIVIQELNKNFNKLSILPENITNHFLPVKSKLKTG